MRRFWDARAEEDPFFFVDNRRDYQDPESDEFWTGGVEVVDGFEDRLGLRITSADEIVEIGCGVGRLTRVLASRAAHVTAIDISQVMLEHARELNPRLENVDWLLGDGASLGPVGDGQADGCFSFVTFQHIPDPEVTLGYVGEMARVLRPGGWAAFQLATSPTVDWRPNLPMRVVRAARACLGRGPRGQSHPSWIGSTVKESDLRHKMEAVGLELQRLAFGGTLHSMVLAKKTPPRASEE
jgi:SAM-dependent methyltransferase